MRCSTIVALGTVAALLIVALLHSWPLRDLQQLALVTTGNASSAATSHTSSTATPHTSSATTSHSSSTATSHKSSSESSSASASSSASSTSSTFGVTSASGTQRTFRSDVLRRQENGRWPVVPFSDAVDPAAEAAHLERTGVVYFLPSRATEAPLSGGVRQLRERVDRSAQVSDAIKTYVTGRRWKPLIDCGRQCHNVTALHVLDGLFKSLRLRYPHVLTYRPRVDCNHGRYLLVRTEYDGFGVSAGSQLLKTLLQLDSHLTGVVANFFTNHARDETGPEQMRFWSFENWEVARPDVMACPPTSPVWQNALDLSGTPPPRHWSQTAVARGQELARLKQPGVVLGQSSGKLDHWTAVGADYFLNRTWILDVQWAYRTLLDTLDPAALVKEAASVDPLTVNLAIHIRRGDIMNKTTGEVQARYSGRYKSQEFYIDAVNGLLSVLEHVSQGLSKELVAVTIYTEGTPSLFRSLIRNITARGYVAAFNGDKKTSRVFTQLADADINVVAIGSAFTCYTLIHAHRLRIGTDRLGLGPGGGFVDARYNVRNFAETRYSPAETLPKGVKPADIEARQARIQQHIAAHWQFLLEWKLRRAEALLRCLRDRTLTCIGENSQYLLTPLGRVRLPA